jgi:hypothetical protein
MEERAARLLKRAVHIDGLLLDAKDTSGATFCKHGTEDVFYTVSSGNIALTH